MIEGQTPTFMFPFLELLLLETQRGFKRSLTIKKEESYGQAG